MPSDVARRKIPPSLYRQSNILFIVLLIFLPHSSRNFALAFCHPGCQCADEQKSVECTNITSIPILFHPMLRSLKVRHAPQLVLDPVSIGLYQELEYLDLSNNNIREIPDGFLGALKKLRELKLRGNRLGTFDPRAFGFGHRHYTSPMRELDLSDNEIERIIVTQRLTKHDSGPVFLRLNLSGNQLHQLDDPSGSTFGSWARHLKKLDLSRNRIAAIDQNLFNQTADLEFLDLSENILSELNANIFHRLQALTQLELARNLIADIDAAAFSGLKELRVLNLANCMIHNLATLRRNWQYLPELRRLTLSANAISQIDALAFDGLYALEELTLSDMPQLRVIKDLAFASLISLKSLTLSNCALLEEIPARSLGERNSPTGALPPTQLRRLDLSANALATVSIALLEDGWTQLSALNLAGNRWRCDCALLDFLPRALNGARLRSNGVDTPPVYCTTPDALFNVQIQEIKHTPQCESSTPGSVPLLALVSVAAAVLAALTTLMALTALICCCCWRYHYGSGASAKSRAARYHDDCVDHASKSSPRGRRLFRRFATALPLIRRCGGKNASDLGASTSVHKKMVAVTGAATTSTASTSSSSASSASGATSYGNCVTLRDACAPLFSGSAAPTESLYYDKAADDGGHLHHSDTIIPYGCVDGNNDYYACIPAGAPPSDYCLPPPVLDYCTYTPRGATTWRPCGAAGGALTASRAVTYGDGVAYAPYLYHSASNYGVVHTATMAHPQDCCEFAAQANNGACCCGGAVLARNAPSFIAPPPPSTIPPPPGAQAANGVTQGE